MGHHYIPQHYLKGFSLDGRRVWVFDRVDKRAFATQVKSIANETDFYPADVERQLANEVEGPGSEVLSAIRSRTAISPRDKRVLAAYMVCMLKRVPRGKELVKERAPGVLEDIIADIHRQLDKLELQEPERMELWTRRREELANPPEGYLDELASVAWIRNLPPEASPKLVEMLSQMRWQFLTFDRQPAFLASDNPFFHFRQLGIARLESEVTFPISSNIALLATWRSELDEGYVATRESWVRELNRRTASIATRYLYHAVDEEWVLPLLCRSTWHTRRLF